MTLASKLRGLNLASIPVNPLKLRPEILLHPNIPKPLHGVNPRTVLGSSWWNKTRKQVYASTNYHCIACGVHKTKAKSRQWMEAHEVYEVDYEKGRAEYVEAVPLCHYCHNYIHDGRLTDLLQRGMIQQRKFVSIIQHGDYVLRAAGLRRKTRAERDQDIITMTANGKFCEWGAWRLVIREGNKKRLFKPIYKTMEEWLSANSISEED